MKKNEQPKKLMYRTKEQKETSHDLQTGREGSIRRSLEINLQSESLTSITLARYLHRYPMKKHVYGKKFPTLNTSSHPYCKLLALGISEWEKKEGERRLIKHVKCQPYSTVE
ncbi:hypothetical protein NPIL_518621 [Nephila pilipes]|uniref:Uncharacterized protein n=1 Tax=Nephila pilipes TaxID=299642 RepID=A0A8X6QWE8_NEPPI|nr:hypothetical protein NPIL_518621 [Nephila pilipes]